MRLILPPTLMSPKAEDYPPHLDPAALDAAREAAGIDPGFSVSMSPEGATYEFHALVNVDAPRFWEVFERLVERIPEQCAIILGERDHEPYYGPYIAKDQLLPILRLFRRELALDPFLEWGVIHQTPTRTEEVFVPHAKYFRVWTSDAQGFRRELESLDLPEREKVITIDCFPLMSVVLRLVVPGAAETRETIERIIERLEDIEVQ